MWFGVGDGAGGVAPISTFRRNLGRLSLAGASPGDPASVSPAKIEHGIRLARQSSLMSLVANLFPSLLAVALGAVFWRPPVCGRARSESARRVPGVYPSAQCSRSRCVSGLHYNASQNWPPRAGRPRGITAFWGECTRILSIGATAPIFRCFGDNKVTFSHESSPSAG